MRLQVIKKNGVLVAYDEQKIIDAVSQSARRALVNLDSEDYSKICIRVLDIIDEEDYYSDELDAVIISVYDMHQIVIRALEELGYDRVAKCYRDYRNYKEDFVKMLDKVYEKAQSLEYIGDVTNANTDSSMISTKRSLTYGELNKELYQKFFLNPDELQACTDGYFYIHDMKDRRDGVNCCLFDVKEVLTDGFEMGNIWYNEPKTLDVAFDVVGDITLSAASQQYGGFTLPEVDVLLEPYAQKSYDLYYKKYINLGLTDELANKTAMDDVKREMEQGFQGWEYKFNTVASSRGDYPFITISFGLCKSVFGKMLSSAALRVREGGQGKKGFKKPVLFPKLTFLYDENLHGVGGELEDVFETAVNCNVKCMYPDYLSLTGNGYIPEMYKKYSRVVSLMG